MSNIPEKGDKINAVYKVNGIVKHSVELGKVQAANKSSYTDEAGNKRPYNYDDNNGVVLVSFTAAPRAAKRTKKKAADKSAE